MKTKIGDAFVAKIERAKAPPQVVAAAQKVAFTLGTVALNKTGEAAARDVAKRWLREAFDEFTKAYSAWKATAS